MCFNHKINKQSLMKKIDYILLEQLIDTYGAEYILNEMKIPNGLTKKIAKGALAAGLLFGGIHQYDKSTHDTKKYDGDYTENINGNKWKNEYGFSDSEYQLFTERVNAVKKEIDRIFKIRGLSKKDLNFSPEHLVYLCHIYNFDIPLLLAQAREESSFGTTRRAKKTKTMFSLGQYDNGKNVCRFKTFDEGIEAYIKTIQKYYLMNGKKTVDDLLKDNSYVDYKGDRFASNPKYEKRLRSIRNDILSRYPILSNDIDPFSNQYDTKTYHLSL